MPFNVLLVESSPAMQQFLRRVFEMPGLPETSCTLAENSEAAERLLAQQPADLIVLDTNSSAADEPNLLQRLGGNPDVHRAACIVISADATATRIQNMLDLGATAYLAKPFAASTLRAEIERSLHAVAARN